MSEHTEPLDAETQAGLKQYWRNNKRIIGVFLVIWFVVSCVLGIFLVEPLNKHMLGGFPLGFWMAQQGSIYVFILIIGIYCWLMEIGDKKFHLQEKQRKKGKGQE